VSFILLLSITPPSFSQKSEFEKLNFPDGGAFGFITGITQDNDGNMWISSKGGLLKYNGSRFTNYQNNPLNTNSISTNTLESVFADENGSIWIGTLGNGLNKLDPKTGVFTHFQHDPDNPSSISNDTVTVILRDSSGDLFIGTHKGLNKYDQENDQFVHYRHDPDDPTSISNDQVRALYEDKKGTLWVGTGSPYVDNGGGPEDGGLNKFDKETEKFTQYLNEPDDDSSLLNNKISAIYEDDKGVLWVGTANLGMHKMDRIQGTFERSVYDPKNPQNLGVPVGGGGVPDYEHITFITQDSAGDYWYGTVENGVCRYDVKGKKIHKFLNEGLQPGSLEGSGTWAAHTSRDGILWLGAVFPGNVFRYNPNKISLEYNQIPEGTFGFYRGEDGDLFVGTGRGYQIRKPNGDVVHHTLINPESSAGEWVSQFMEDINGNLWVSGFNGLNRRDGSSGEWASFDLKAEGGHVVEGRASSMLIDQNDNFWVGTINGLCRLEPKTGKVSRTFMRREDTSIIGQNVVSCLLEQDQSHIWVGLFNGGGLYLYEPSTDSAKKYLSSVDMIDLYRDHKGVVWAANSDGVYWFDDVTDQFVRFINPLLSNGIPEATGIVEDDDNYLWVSSTLGLVQINPQRDEIGIYDHTMGVERYNFSWDSGFKDKDGKIFFGNDQGYYVIDAGFLNRETRAPEIKLTGFRLTDEYVTPNERGPLKETLSKAEKIVLDYDQNIFSFDFATIDYTNPDRNRMIYYLENFDRNWSLANSENRAYYFNVPPGEYTFHVKSSKGVGPWASRKIDLIISPPWWRTWWAYSAYAIILGLCIFGFDRFMRQRLIRIERERSREKELKQAKEIEKAYTELKNTQAQLIQSEKMASLGELTAGIAHEIQNPLNFVNNFSEVSQELVSEMREELDKGQLKEALELSENIENNLEKISHHGKRASDIVKGMLQHSRATGATKEKTDLNKLADEYFRLAYHGLRAKDKSFTSKMETSFDKKLEKIKVIPQDIGRVLLNIITNAFHVVSEKKKESPDSYEPSVTLSTKNLMDRIEIRVSDNGNGIPKEILEKIFQPFFTTKPSGKGTGLGLSLSYDIVKAHGGQLEVDTQEGAGTTFIIKLPKT
jgi:signal transduction histidine kinase/ligand-binding sensor domain-containing protein